MGHALCICSRGTVTIDHKRYLFIHKLGEGGFSFVDLVEGLHDGQFYALKRILCHEQQDREEAQREADMHRLFHHPNILRLVAYCLRERGTKHEAWLLLPFFKRGTLWNEIEKLKDKGNFLTEEQIIRLLLGICRGLEAIHAKGYAHRDLKPTNILLGDEGQPVLMDLGSMNQACIHVEGSRQALALQDWAAQRCTISYRAPELFSVQSHCVIDERTDVWAFFSLATAANLNDDCGPPAAPSHSSAPESVGGAADPGSGRAHYPHLNKPEATLRRWPPCLGKELPSLSRISIHSVQDRALVTGGSWGLGQFARPSVSDSALTPKSSNWTGGLPGWGLGRVGDGERGTDRI
ncbi:serine/threonine-protein kinase 16 isoform 1-T2 [Dama dama]|uniref:serine/threonine-protein kinase 16 isoform X1 n=1 Tax=Dama dama TaxID=30532 RepID=UPI002A360BC8|nr:serine/threonine-protein kinase 16 isoform X1 [Dama dama]XP_061004665.1 serine/threonine-protein kinase 16 isoform X1 [Dama dama]